MIPPPRTPDGQRIYVIGDIHGRHDLLRRMHGLIMDDSSGSGAVAKTVLYLGDYVDRGPESFEIVDTLIDRPLSGFDHVFLKGNHEDMLLRFLENGECADIWLSNGGAETLRSYGIDADPFSWTPSSVCALRDEFRAALPDIHLGFFRGLEHHRVFGDYVFVHAGLRPGIDLDGQHGRDLMWIRHEFLQWESPFPGVVVHGHSIAPQPEFRANRIGIDTGAYRSGRLTCLILEGTERRILQT